MIFEELVASLLHIEGLFTFDQMSGKGVSFDSTMEQPPEKLGNKRIRPSQGEVISSYREWIPATGCT